MSYLSMTTELTEAIPALSRVYARTLVNRAWRVVRDSALWSFQLKPGSFSTPAIITAGTVTVPALPSPPLIVGDAVASAAWTNLFPFITTRQFRIGDYSIYNVIAADFTVPTAVVLTLDRPFAESGVVNQLAGNPYNLFQCYIPAPSATFRRWLSIQDMVNGWALGISDLRRDVNIIDPQRQQATDPFNIFGMGQDARAGSGTLGWQMFELWPYPTSVISYMTWYVDRGADLVSNADTLPDPIPEEVVMFRARAYAYEWAEARRDVMAARGSGPGYAALIKEANAQFYARLKTIRIEDKDVVDALMQQINAQGGAAGVPFYNATTGIGNPGFPQWRRW